MRLAWVEGEVGISTRQRAVLHVLQRPCLVAQINSNAVVYETTIWTLAINGALLGSRRDRGW
jgi:hypothetical protein